MISSKLKKILIIISIVVTIILLLLLVYFFVLKPENSPKLDSKVNVTEDSEDKKASVLIEDEVLDYTISPSNEITYYKKSNGHTYTTNNQGSKPKLVSDFDLNKLSKVEWAPSKPFVLTNLDSKFSIYNYISKKSFELPSDISQVGFLSDNRVYYVAKNSIDLYDIIVSNEDASEKDPIMVMMTDKVLLDAVPLSTNISQILSPPSAFRESPLRIISTVQKSASSILEAKYGLNVSWSPMGDRGIITYSSEKGGKEMYMSLIDNKGVELISFKPIGTIAEKITWSSDGKAVYFTQPLITNNKIMPDDYYDNKLSKFYEALYKIDLTTLEADVLSKNIGLVDSRDLMLSASGKELFFINKNDNKLYKYSIE